MAGGLLKMSETVEIADIADGMLGEREEMVDVPAELEAALDDRSQSAENTNLAARRRHETLPATCLFG